MSDTSNFNKVPKLKILIYLVFIAVLVFSVILIIQYKGTVKKQGDTNITSKSDSETSGQDISKIKPLPIPNPSHGIEIIDRGYFKSANITGTVEKDPYKSGDEWYINLQIGSESDRNQIITVLINKENFDVTEVYYEIDKDKTNKIHEATPVTEIISMINAPTKITVGIDYDINDAELEGKLQRIKCDEKCISQVRFNQQFQERNEEIVNKYLNGESVNGLTIGPVNTVEIFN